MPFGLSNAPVTFQAIMKRIFQSFLRKFIVVFFDDILVYSKDLAEHLIHLEAILQVLQEHQFFVKASKCSFATTTIDYLGHVVSVQGISPDPSKIQGVQEWLFLLLKSN